MCPAVQLLRNGVWQGNCLNKEIAIKSNQIKSNQIKSTLLSLNV
jgi:hypothetical protein